MFFRFYILFFPACLSIAANSQQSPFIFYHLTEKDGLSNNAVNCFLKDSRGILWVATFDGLNRFDGSHFFSYKKTKDSNSIINNTVHDLCEDRQGNIWGATDNGIFRFNPEKNSFSSYLPPNSKVSPATINIAPAVYNILCDKNGTIWATGLWTILKFNPVKNVFEEIGPLTLQSDSLNHYAVRKNGLVEDPSGNGLWMATRFKGMHYYDIKTGQFLSFKNQKTAIFKERAVSALTISATGRCWFYDNTLQQIVNFDPVSKSEILKIDMKGSISSSICASLFEDSENRLWYGNWNNEIAVVEYKNSISITRIKNDKSDPLSIAGNFLWNVMEDEDGTLWLGTIGGISKCNTSKSIYRVRRFEEKFPFLKGNSIRLIVEDTADKSWWLVTSDKLYVIHFFPATERYFVYDLQKAEKNIHGKLPGPVHTIRFIMGKAVLCTHTGAWQIDTASQRVQPFYIAAAVDPSLVISDIIEKNGVYYINDERQLLKYVSRENKAYRIKHTVDRLPDGQKPGIKFMTFTPDNRLWGISNFGWLVYLDDKEELVPFYYVKNENEELFGYINSVYMDKDGKLWMTSIGVGLYCFTPATRSVKYWTESDGLVINHLQTVVADNNSHIWCAANNKFSVFTPSTGSFYNFSLPLGENQSFNNGMTLLSNGNIVVTIQNSILEFFPERLTLKPHIKQPLIGTVNIAGKERFIGDENSIRLNPDEKFLSLKFGLLTDKETFPYSFEYMLKGIDETWVPAGADNQAVYNKLPSGNYTFRLKAKARNGAWETPETTLMIHIKTPFFRSAWFYGAMVLLTGLLLFLFYRFRIAKQKQLHELESKAQLLEKEKALVMYESLKQQLNPHFLFNSLTSLSSLIRMDRQLAGEFLDKMSKVYRYILKNRDTETVPLGEELKAVQLFIDLQKTRFEDALVVNMNIDDEHHHRKIVPVTLQNLVENAIKHNVADNSAPLQIDLFVKDDYLLVQNNLQKKNFVETSNKQGLANMESLYHYLSDRPMLIKEDENNFTVKIPLL